MVPLRISQLDFDTTAPSPDWDDIVYAESIGVWLALKPDSDKVARSTDGLTWTYEDLPMGANWLALVWSEEAELFAAFCTNNSAISVATSPDGITWTNAHPENSLCRSCVYGQGKFVGVGGIGQSIGISTFTKANFALAGVGSSTRTVSFNANLSTLLLVGIVGETSDVVTGVTFNSVAMTLVDKVQATGDRWIYLFKLLSPTLGGSFDLTVSFSTTNQGSAIHIAGYSNAGDVLQFDTDTGNGSSITTSLTTTYDLSWLAQFSVNVADSTGTNGTGGTVRTTTDTQGGTLADSAAAKTPPGSHSIAVNVTASDWAAITVAFRPAVTLGFLNSADGVTWTESESPNVSFQAIAYSPELDLFCALARNGLTTGVFAGMHIFTSPDGTTWTPRTLATGANSIAGGNCILTWADDLGLFVAVLTTGDVATSDDGINWSLMTLSVDPNATQVEAVTWAKRLGALMFVGDDDGVSGLKPLMFSEDGETIESVDFTGLAGSWSRLVYSPVEDRLVAFGQFNADYAMLVEFGPSITEVDPPSGDIVGGNTVNVIGTGFEDGAQVVFGNVFATDVVVVSDVLITCVVPPHATVEFVDVTVTNPDARYDVGDDFYEYATDTSGDEPGGTGTPQIGLLGVPCAPGSIDPAFGPIAGGTPVTIYGQGFRVGSTVLFGGSPATSVVVDVSGTFLTCVTPAHQSGEVDVEVLEP